MDDLDLMARGRQNAERVEPVLRRTSRARADLDIGLRDADRPGGGRRGATTRDRTPDEPRRGRAKTSRKRKKKKKGIVRRVLRTTLILFGVGVVAVGGVVAYYASKLPDLTSWAVPDRPPNIQIRAADGTVIANRGQTGGETVTLEELPAYLPQAIVAIEDRRFYSHLGVDPIGLARVLVGSATSGDRLTGASTITQQLSRTLFLSLDRTLERKIQEAILAVWLELQYGKDDILEMYMNRVYFGAGATGIDAAARVYFGKPASEVTLAEAATLAGLLPAPSRYAPTVNPEAAKARQRLVLQAMVEEGYITAEDAAAAEAGEIVTVDPVASGSGSYIADWVADLVPSFVGTIQGDIVVDTTIDIGLQAEAATALRAGLDENGAALGASQGALVAMEPDGAVRAMVGGRDYAESQFNRAVNARRQPGSSFKPFVYLTALEFGLMPETIRIDQPVNIDGWTPENYSEEYQGPVSLQRALALSLNTISVQLTQEVGPEAVVRTAQRLGITSELDPNPSIALGTSEVSPLEMVGAYATFANGGYGIIPYAITRIRTVDGDILYQRESDGLGAIVGPEQIGMMNAMLREVVASGTGRQAVLEGWDIAGKTGTSQDFRDAWFIGYSAMMVTGIWVGNDDNTPTNRASGGNLPAQVWSQFMAAAHEGWEPLPLPGSYIFRDPANFDLVAPQAILGEDGVYDEYLQRYEPGPNGEFIQQPPAGIPADRYDPAYDPRYDPNVPDGMVAPNGVIGGQPLAPGPGLPPAPIGGDPNYQPVPQPDQGGGFIRRILGMN